MLMEKQNWRKQSFRQFVIMKSTRSSLIGFGHVRGLGSFRALHNLEFDRISFLQCPVTVADDR